MNKVLISAGYKRCKTDSCIYVRRSSKSLVIVAVYVDDLLICYNESSWKDKLKSTLTKNFNMKDLGDAKTMLNMRIDYDRKSGILRLDQPKYTESILKRFNMGNCDPVKTPSDASHKLTREMSPSSPNEKEKMQSIPYQEAVGSVLYLVQCTRPDIAFSVANVSQFNQNPGPAHWKGVKRIMRYLKGTLDYKLTFSRGSAYKDLCCYSDPDWGTSFCDRRSCTGYVFLWQGGAISWKSKAQPTVALSTTESEYMAMSAASQQC